MLRTIFTLLAFTIFAAPGHSSELSSLDEAITLNEQFRANNPEVLKTTNVENYLPTDLAAGSNESVIAEKIALKSADSLVKNIHIKSKSAKMVAQTISEGVAVKANFDFSTGDNSSKTSHKFSFNAELASSQATITYKGLIDAKVKYSVSNNETSLDINESLGEHSSLNISQSLANDASSTNVSFSLTY